MQKDKFLRNNLIVFFGSLVVSALSYLYYPVLAHLMPLDAFGESQTLISIFTQAALIFSAINIITVVLIARGANERNENFLNELQKLVVYVTIFVGLLAAICSPFLRNFFNFQSIWPFMAMILALVANVPFAYWNSYLQGREEFMAMNVLGVLGAGGKLLASVAFVLVGWGSLGAILGLFAGQIVAVAFVKYRYSLPSLSHLFKMHWPKWKILRLEIRYTGLVFFVSLMVAALYSGDVLMVKHFQNPESAGIYAGISSIARIIFFLTLPFAVVLLPAINKNGQNRRATLIRSTKLVILLGGLATLVFALFSNEVVRVLIGGRYLPYAHLLPKLSLAIFVIALSNLFFCFLLSKRSVGSLFIAFIGLLAFVGLSAASHDTVEAIVNNLLIAGGLTLLLLLIVMSFWPRLRYKFDSTQLLNNAKEQQDG